MANVALFKSGQTPVYLVSVHTQDYASDPDAIINPDITAVASVPLKYWKRVGDLIEEMSAGEKTAVDDAIALALLITRRAIADSVTDISADEGIKWRALALMLVDEFNILRGVVIGTGSVVWDAPNMANAAGATSPNITVNGAAFGDFVDVACSGTFAGLIAFGYVSAANTVTIRLHNGTGGAINLGSLTYNVVVRRDVTLPNRTIAQVKASYKNKISAGSAD